ncbi:MAG: type I 3-dehydroquinate dehydratase [Candidatus Bathyarchaeota archaeon]|nr:type I 3-dehydroquinate dehydratase [Candidatus Bathyarchaeota archaeon]
MSPNICVSILPSNMDQALSLIEKAEQAQANLIEVRLDYLEETRNLKTLTSSTNLPLIATNKLQSEKGHFSGSENERQQTLLEAAKDGFQYVDIDFSSPKHDETISKIKALGAKPISSYHKFDGILTTSAMKKILDEQIASGASVCKIVVTAKQIEDNLPILSFVSFASTKAKLVCFCMGEEGKISRLLSPLFGAFFTFASLEQGSQTATGQMSINEMHAAYRLLGIKL